MDTLLKDLFLITEPRTPDLYKPLSWQADDGITHAIIDDQSSKLGYELLNLPSGNLWVEVAPF